MYRFSLQAHPLFPVFITKANFQQWSLQLHVSMQSRESSRVAHVRFIMLTIRWEQTGEETHGSIFRQNRRTWLMFEMVISNPWRSVLWFGPQQPIPGETKLSDSENGRHGVRAPKALPKAKLVWPRGSCMPVTSCHSGTVPPPVLRFQVRPEMRRYVPDHFTPELKWSDTRASSLGVPGHFDTPVSGVLLK